MKTYDVKHIAYHALIGLYFIWLPTFCLLLWASGSATYTSANSQYNRIFLLWIVLNYVMGSSLFFVIRLFGYKNAINTVILYSYITMALAGLGTILFMVCKI